MTRTRSQSAEARGVKEDLHMMAMKMQSKYHHSRERGSIKLSNLIKIRKALLDIKLPEQAAL